MHFEFNLLRIEWNIFQVKLGHNVNRTAPCDSIEMITIQIPHLN